MKPIAAIRHWWRWLWHHHFHENVGPVERVYERGIPSVRQWRQCKGCGERVHLTIPVLNPYDGTHGDACKGWTP